MHTHTHRGGEKVRSQELRGTLGALKQNRLFLLVSVLCWQSRASVKRRRLNLSARRRTRLTRGAGDKCEFLFEAGNCSWHTQFLTSFLLFFTASASSQSTTYLNSPLFACQSEPSQRTDERRGGRRLPDVHSEAAPTRGPRGLEHAQCKVWKRRQSFPVSEAFPKKSGVC